MLICSGWWFFGPPPPAHGGERGPERPTPKRPQPIDHEQACGGTPINGMIVAARQHRLTPHLLDLRSSGDTAGSYDQVVGYAALAFTEEMKNEH